MARVRLEQLRKQTVAVAPPVPPQPAPSPKPAPAPPRASGSPLSNPSQSAWVKLCEKNAGVAKDKDGKEEKKEVNICLTHHERLDGETGMVQVSAAVRQIDGQEKQHLMVMVPLGMMQQAGLRATVYPKDLWEKVQKKEALSKEDESRLKAIKMNFTLCHPAGCTAEIEANPELLTDLKSSGGLVAFAINASGSAVGFPIPLRGFAETLAGPPVDSKKYGEARKALMEQIAQRQSQLVEEQKRQQAAQPSSSPKAAPPSKR
jgi:invasion protein IalB